MLHMQLSNIQKLDMDHSWFGFCKEKDPKTKEYYEKLFISYRNHISSLLRKTKDSYHKQYFEDN